MKKVLYSLALVVLGLASCATWDDPTTENYGEGPAISVSAVLATPSDSAITISITPAEGTLYYAFVLDQSDVDESADLDASTLLKGNYGGQVINANEQPVVNVTVGNLAPNTTYQVYAVASSDKGIVGKIANASVTTTDGSKPGISTYSRDAENKAVKLPFSEAVQRGEGAVTARYYKEWDLLNPVDIATEDIEVSISGKTVTLAAPTAPAGAYVTFSYEEGAFVDATGNKCAAINSGLNMTTGNFSGIYVRVPTEAFEVTDENITSPADNFVFGDIAEFVGTLKFDFGIFRNEQKVEKGDLSVVYQGEDRTVEYSLDVDDWSVEGAVLSFKLPVAPESGETVRLYISEGVFFDVYGNPNAEFTSSLTWKYSLYKPTAEDVLGTFNYYVTLNSNGKTYNLGPVTISEYTGDDAEEGDVVISGLYLGEDAEDIVGYYDLAQGKFYIYRYQALGTYEEDGETYGVLTYSVGGNSLIPFDITADGLVSTDFALAYSDAAYSQLKGYEVPAGQTVFVKAQASAARTTASASAKSKKSQIVKGLKGSPKKVKAIRK